MKQDALYLFIGRRIREERLKQGMTQEELAEKAEISVSFPGHIERGTRKLSVATLFEIASALHCATDELLGTGVDFSADSRQIICYLAELLKDKTL